MIYHGAEIKKRTRFTTYYRSIEFKMFKWLFKSLSGWIIRNGWAFRLFPKMMPKRRLWLLIETTHANIPRRNHSLRSTVYTVAIVCPHWSVNGAFIWISFSVYMRIIKYQFHITHNSAYICNSNEQMHYAIIKTPLDRGIVFSFLFRDEFHSCLSSIGWECVCVICWYVCICFFVFFSALFSPFFHLFISLCYCIKSFQVANNE